MKMKRSEIVHTLTVLLTLLGGALAYADQIQAVGLIPPKMAHWWPMVLAGASALRGIVRILADYLDDWRLNDSVKALAWFAGIGSAVLLSGCANTVADEKGFRTQANASRVEYRRASDGTITLVMDGVNHATPTRAGGSVAGTVGSAVVSGISAAAAGL